MFFDTSIPQPDSDDDGISDVLDDQDLVYSQFFTNGFTYGTITSGQEFLTITDAPGFGVKITATGPATIGGCLMASVSFVTGASKLSCGSITIEVISGTVDVTLTNIVGTPTITLSEGVNVTIDDQTLELTNNLDTDAIIFINNQQTTITSSSSVNLDAFIDSDSDGKADSSDDSGQDSTFTIPEWIKLNAAWWSEGKVSDDTFVNGMQYLIKEDIMKIPKTQPVVDSGSNEIPSWIKQNAAWWSEGKVSDDTFVNGMQWIIQNGIIRIN